MKTRIALLILWGAVLVGSAAAEDPVSFADATLKAAVEEALWIDNPTPSDMLGLTDLVCLNSDIKDLTGLEYATHLQSLYLRYNQISDLSPLLGLTHLQSIDLSRNPISDISPLAGLTGLINLNLHGNPISDLSSLAGLSQLQDLNLRENRITNISPLTGLTNLLNLYITFNQVCDLAPLASLNHLQSLELYGNPFTDISNLLGLTHLSILRIGWTDLNDKAYCSDIQTMLDNNPGLFLEYDPNPRPPTGVSASDGTYPDKVRITWDPVCNGPAYTSYYRVSRASSQDGPRIPLSPWQTACSFDDTSALSGTPYTYWVQTASSSQGLDPGDPSTPNGGWLSHKPTLTLSSTSGGVVTMPGQGLYVYEVGELVHVEADPIDANLYVFAGWTGTAIDAGKVADTNQVSTTVTVDGSYTLKAHFMPLMDTLYVDDDAPSDPQPGDPSVSHPQEKGSTNLPFDSIQEAIDVAPNRATVIVRPGTYAEDIDLLGKTIHLTGLDPNIPLAMSAYPIITGTGSGPIVRFASGEDPNCRLSGFVFSQSKALPAYTIYCSKASPSFDHCLIVGNRSSTPNGAVVLCQDSRAVFDHCTLADNLAGAQGAGLVLVDSNVTITHSILWGNAPSDILLTGTSLPSIAYTDLTGDWLGLGTIDDDPLFARPGYWADPVTHLEVMDPTDPRAVWMPGDYHLRSQAGRWEEKTGTWVQDDLTSPCIDAGDPVGFIGYESLPNGGIVNLGAYGGSAQASKSYIANDPVSFADRNLKAAVEQALGIDDPTASDMLGLTSLDASSLGITDLTGLEYATHLQALNLRRNKMTDLSPLAGLILLQDLDVSRTGVTGIRDISPLAGLVNLKRLLLDNNQITDISPLTGLILLEHLDLHDQKIRDISPLAGLVHMKYFNLRYNQISDVSALAGMTELQYLDLGYNRLDNISPLAGMGHLQQLELYLNPLSNISDLTGMTSLSVLTLGWTELNNEAYCSHLKQILQNNPGLSLKYDPNPRPPTGLTASDGTYPDKVRVSWDPVCNGPAFTTYYRVYRAASLDGPQTALSPWQTSCIFDDTTAQPGMTYTYWVQTATSGQGVNAGDLSLSDRGWLKE